MNYFEILLTLFFGIILNFSLSIMLIKILKVKLLSFIISFVASLLFFILLTENLILTDFEFLVLLFFYISLCFFIIWFFYTFAQGFSSRVLENVYILKNEKKVIKQFKEKKFNNLILAERIPYLMNGNFLIKKKEKYKVSKKGLIICRLHKFICKLMNIKMGGGLID